MQYDCNLDIELLEVLDIDRKLFKQVLIMIKSLKIILFEQQN